MMIRYDIVDRREDPHNKVEAVDDFIHSQMHEGGIEKRLEKLIRVVSDMLVTHVNSGGIDADDLVYLLDAQYDIRNPSYVQEEVE